VLQFRIVADFALLTEPPQYELSEKPSNRDELKMLSYGTSELFWTAHGPEVHWSQNIKMTGDYRVMVKFTTRDVIRLLRESYGTE
jgi:hypothetical protein